MRPRPDSRILLQDRARDPGEIGARSEPRCRNTPANPDPNSIDDDSRVALFPYLARELSSGEDRDLLSRIPVARQWLEINRGKQRTIPILGAEEPVSAVRLR